MLCYVPSVATTGCNTIPRLRGEALPKVALSLSTLKHNTTSTSGQEFSNNTS